MRDSLERITTTDVAVTLSTRASPPPSHDSHVASTPSSGASAGALAVLVNSEELVSDVVRGVRQRADARAIARSTALRVERRRAFDVRPQHSLRRQRRRKCACAASSATRRRPTHSLLLLLLLLPWLLMMPMTPTTVRVTSLATTVRVARYARSQVRSVCVHDCARHSLHADRVWLAHATSKPTLLATRLKSLSQMMRGASLSGALCV
jgi:hypothetical protein